MQAKPMFLGACALASIAGAIGGATINTHPIQKAGIGSAMLPQTEFAFDPSDNGWPQVALPDHYAMTTPDGRIEVAELATRGLYAQQRFGWRQASYEPPPLPQWPEPESEWSERGIPAEQTSAEAPAPAREAAQQEPAEAEEVTPRVIDVAAELAG